MQKNWIILFITILSFSLNAQDRFDVLDEKLIQLAKSYPGVNDKVELSMNGATVHEYVRAIGLSNNLNVNVDPGRSFFVFM
ncbi:MAG: hypothetical protein IPI93_06145 [Sphingobacteriaceae bacterium]|nr:hypothetical protein [Sphingobacteriaceae bacterium]